jgi:hypothetical protein
MPANNAAEANRFGYLMAPIRDLTANWKIDIASELEEYLTELESIQISFDGGATNLNFAEGTLCKLNFLHCVCLLYLYLCCVERSYLIFFSLLSSPITPSQLLS